ncbi:hypothetical protein AB0I81_53995 [Nonomuraea sp. NPDC050404]
MRPGSGPAGSANGGDISMRKIVIKAKAVKRYDRRVRFWIA